MRIELPKGCRQLLAVAAKHVDGIPARLCLLQFYKNEGWVPKLAAPCVVGKKGLASSEGWQIEGNEEKKEGDLKTPVGLSPITTAFGYSPAPPTVLFPYIALSAHHRGIDDPLSIHYNRIIDQQKVEPDWQSAETMLRDDGLYKYGAETGYNQHPALPGKGSCIFLHIWRSADIGTEGCIAAEKGVVKNILSRFDSALQPHLLVLPEKDFERYPEWHGKV